MQEAVIIRNSIVKSLYDVALVDYMQEEVEYLTKAVDFETAQGIVLEYDTSEETTN